jgi:hypothetical protein
MVLTTWLEKIMQSITNEVLKSRKGSWKQNFMTLWHEDDIEESLKLLDTPQCAFGVLTGMLQM